MKASKQPCARRIHRLNRRQRKKQYLGEFQEMGFHLCWGFQSVLDDDSLDNFCDRFILMIESRGLCCAGSFSSEGANCFIVRLGRGTVTTEDHCAVVDWLQAANRIASVKAGALSDSWYGDIHK